MKLFRLINLLFFATLLACSEKEAVPYYHTADFTPYWKGESEFSIDTFHTIAPFRFINQDGDSVTKKTFEGKIYVANFFFTICPGICPKLTGNLSKVAAAFEDQSDVKFISHSVTPEIDSVRQLKQYASDHGIKTMQWNLVTGNKDEIYSLARESYFAEKEIGFTNSGNAFLHTEHFILIDRQGHIRGIYNGTLELEADRLIEDIRNLL